jgi:alkanesulfonate monooxygenase SsuD/methylene tetrahydromethanopterin reductase-like flavin-dependent oxidoreductase (luciferase family)
MNWMSMLKLVYCAESEEQAYEELRPVLIRYLIQTAKANSSDYILEDQASEQADEFIQRAMFVGTPKQIADRINSYGEVGITNMLIWQTFGEMPHEQTMRSLRLFTEKTLPLLDLETEAPR